jgi:hypothetical protein
MAKLDGLKLLEKETNISCPTVNMTKNDYASPIANENSEI